MFWLLGILAQAKAKAAAQQSKDEVSKLFEEGHVFV